MCVIAILTFAAVKFGLWLKIRWNPSIAISYVNHVRNIKNTFKKSDVFIEQIEEQIIEDDANSDGDNKHNDDDESNAEDNDEHSQDHDDQDAMDAELDETSDW